MIVTCKKCGVELFEDRDESTHFKHVQFRSFATRKDDEGNKYYLCVDCHENMGVPMINVGPYSVRDEELTLKRPKKPSTVLKITD